MNTNLLGLHVAIKSASTTDYGKLVRAFNEMHKVPYHLRDSHSLLKGMSLSDRGYLDSAAELQARLNTEPNLLRLSNATPKTEYFGQPGQDVPKIPFIEPMEAAKNILPIHRQGLTDFAKGDATLLKQTAEMYNDLREGNSYTPLEGVTKDWSPLATATTKGLPKVNPALNPLFRMSEMAQP